MTKRPLLVGVAAFVIGEWLGQDSRMAMGIGMVGLGCLAFCLWGIGQERRTSSAAPVFFLRGKRRKAGGERSERGLPAWRLSLAAVCALCLLLGCVNGTRCQAEDAFQAYLEETYAGKSIACTVTGKVRRAEAQTERTILLVETDGIAGDTFRTAQTYLVRLYAENPDAPAVGSRIEAEVSLWQPSAPTNPGEFDSRAYYRARGIEFLGTVQTLQVTAQGRSPIRQWLTELRARAGQVLQETLPEEEAGLLRAMLLGDTGALDSSVRKLCQRNGIAHILAISGVKTENLAIPQSGTKPVNTAFVAIHYAKKYIQKLCFSGNFMPRCRFPSSRG